MTLSAAYSKSMPWAARPPAAIRVEPNTAAPIDFFTLRSSSVEWFGRLWHGAPLSLGDAHSAAPPNRVSIAPLVVRSCASVANDLVFFARQMHRSEVEGQLVDLAVEGKRYLVVQVV